MGGGGGEFAGVRTRRVGERKREMWKKHGVEGREIKKRRKGGEGKGWGI